MKKIEKEEVFLTLCVISFFNIIKCYIGGTSLSRTRQETVPFMHRQFSHRVSNPALINHRYYCCSKTDKR